ncbi:MAG: glycosyltransferase family 1 protein [Patescibacteria group bacterium]|jgi:glycosyltransferase involved in cell wall biosynthesis
MRIGIDCRTILNPKGGERAGVGYYTYFLVKSLLATSKQNDFVLFFDSRFHKTKEFEQPNVKIRHFPFSQYKRFLPFSYSHMLISAILDREKLDIYHSPANVLPYLYRRPSVVTVHDLAIYQHPEWFPKRQKFSTSVLVPRSLQRARRIIAVSEATKNDIIRTFKVEPKKISVIYEGVNKEKSQLTAEGVAYKYDIKLPYVLYVGTIEPRKNIDRLVKAYRSVVTKHPSLAKYQLVLAGHRGWKSTEVFQLLSDPAWHERIKYLNYIPHDDKISLIAGAAVFVFPSLYEGFGLPVLEAMALGVPVITSNTSSLPEVAGTAALPVNPRSDRAIADGLVKLLKSNLLREQLSRAGLEQTKKFGWLKCARETLRVYQDAVKAK